MRSLLIHFASILILLSGLWCQSEVSSSTSQSNGDSSPPMNSTVPKMPAALPDSAKLEIVRMIHAVYPPAAEKQKLNGKVVVKILISQTGDVKTAEVVSGDPVLVPAALDAAKQWQFKPYIRNGAAIQVSLSLPFVFEYRDKVPDETSQGAVDGNASKNDASPPKPRIDGLFAVRISEDTARKMVIQRTNPLYPPLAREARLQGVVVMFVVIGKRGDVQDLRVISGHPLLVPSCVTAVKKWRFRPYVLDGEPIEVQTTISSNFTLSGY